MSFWAAYEGFAQLFTSQAVGGGTWSFKSRILSSFSKHMRRDILHTSSNVRYYLWKDQNQKTESSLQWKVLPLLSRHASLERSSVQGITFRNCSAFEVSDTVMVPDNICRAHSELASISVSSEFPMIALFDLGLLEARAESTPKWKRVILCSFKGGCRLRKTHLAFFKDGSPQTHLVARPPLQINRDVPEGAVETSVQGSKTRKDLSPLQAIAAAFGLAGFWTKQSLERSILCSFQNFAWKTGYQSSRLSSYENVCLR